MTCHESMSESCRMPPEQLFAARLATELVCAFGFLLVSSFVVVGIVVVIACLLLLVLLLFVRFVVLLLAG